MPKSRPLELILSRESIGPVVGRRLVVPLAMLGALAVGAILGKFGRGEAVYLAEPDGVERSAEISGQFAAFDNDRSLYRQVTLSGESRRSITPPFPSRLSFAIDVPESGVLEFGTALVVMQQVRRARVRFTASVVDASASTPVFEETLTISDANRFRDSRAVLGRWAGQTVAIVLEVKPVPSNREPLWADRVQAVWADPVVRRAGIPALTTDTVEGWLDENLAWDADVSARLDLRAFGMNLFLAGASAWFIAWCYRRLSSDRALGLPFAGGFTLFTLIATLLIAVVHSSVALSLGLLGALSIVRFRHAVQESDHLLGLLLCITVALALGTNQRLLALTVVIPVVLAVLVRGRQAASPRKFYVTVRGRVNDRSASSVFDRLEDVADTVVIERFSINRDEVDVRARLVLEDAGHGRSLPGELNRRFPSFRLSFNAVDTHS